MTATQEEAALAYDIAAIEHRGLNAVTNFDISHYVNWYRRRRRGDDDGLDATETIPVEQPKGLTEHARATTCLDGTVTAAAAFDDIADSYIVQLPDDQARMPTWPALDQLLLQSPKFAEIMEQVSVAPSTTESSTGPSSPSTLSSSSPSSLSRPSPERQPESSSGSGASSSARCSFPDDVQTYFECDDVMSFAFAEVDTFLFGDLGAYAAPMFQCDLDVLV
jgi:AP2-like factor, ANT lineage